MKNLLFVAIIILFTKCSVVNTVIPSSNTTYQTRNDFKSVDESTKENFLEKKGATTNNKSVLILTQGFKGEKIKITQDEKTIYSKYPITNLKTKYADSFSFNNTSDLIFYDGFTKNEITIESNKLNGSKFVYIMKYLDDDKTKYRITLSDNLKDLN